MSFEEELNELKESREIVEIKNAVGERLRGSIVSVEEDRVIYEGLKILAGKEGYQKDERERAIVMRRGDVISNIQITKIKDEKVRGLIESAIYIIKRNKENQKKEENIQEVKKMESDKEQKIEKARKSFEKAAFATDVTFSINLFLDAIYEQNEEIIRLLKKIAKEE